MMSDDGRREHFLTQSNADATSASWAPDGARISYTERTPEYFSGKVNVVKFDPQTGQQLGDPVTLYTSPTDRGGSWSVPEGEVVAR